MKKAGGILLKKKLVMLGMTIPLLINSLSSKAQQQNCRWEKYHYYVKINGKWERVGAYICVPIQTTSSNNSNLYKQKKKQEFKPPELPYCRVVRADWEGVVIDYWDKRGKKHTYRWAVTQPHWYVGGATVDLVHEYPEQDNGDRDYEGLDECLIRAGKKVLEDSYAGGNGNLYIKKMTGYVFDHLTLYYNEE